MKITLHKLTLENFKGIKKFTLEPKGKNAVVKGDNGTGKTTLFDAFPYLLFGKDSLNRTNFDLKTLKQGKPIHNLVHSVEGVVRLEYGDKSHDMTLRKEYVENWTKKRGEAKKTLTGHTVNHFINDEPKSKSEYDAWIKEIVDEELFRVLTNPFHFPSLHWQKRRNILLAMCGDVSDDEVVASNKKLQGLKELLGDKTLESYRKIIKKKLDDINKEMAGIPVIIKELSRAKEPEVSLNELQDILAAVSSEIEEREKSSKNSEVLNHIDKASESLSLARQEHWKILKEKNERLDKEIREGRKERIRMLSAAGDKMGEVGELKVELEDLRRQFNKIAKSIKDEEGGTCSFCGQALPEKMLGEVEKESAAKQAKLDEINKKGRSVKAKLAEAEAEAEALDKKNEEAFQYLQSLEAEQQSGISGKEKELSEWEETIKDLRGKINSEESTPLAALESKKYKLAQEIAEARQYEQVKKRIDELSREEETLADKFEEATYEMALVDQFISTKTKMLEERINSKFTLAKFRLFEEQISEGVKETCEILYEGVPYGSGLNRGAQTNVGLDIIRTLSEHYNIWAPVFCDNAEAVTKLLDPGTQTIKLYVAEGVKEMEVSYEQ